MLLSKLYILDYDGDVLMCPHDWGEKRKLGNLKNQSLKIFGFPRFP